jgi:hypothetical protein
MSSKLMGRTHNKGYLVFVDIDDRIFCEIRSGFMGVNPTYYELSAFDGVRTLQRILAKDFDNFSPEVLINSRTPYLQLAEKCSPTESGPIARFLFDAMVSREICTYMAGSVVKPFTHEEITALGSKSERTSSINVFQNKQNDELYYTMNNVIYSARFPIEWALTPATTSWVDEDGITKHKIMGPGSSTIHCNDCNVHGAFQSVFIGYCNTCSNSYPQPRISKTYPVGDEILQVGIDSDAECCLTGGPVPIGPDICDNQDDMDPVREDVIDEYLVHTRNSSSIDLISGRHPRRSYGIQCSDISSCLCIKTQQTEVITPDIIRQKMEMFFAANACIAVTNNNYSFPIGPRAEWDHYRMEKRPSYWYAWEVTLRKDENEDDEYYNEDVSISIRLYLSNVHSEEHPASLVMECNNYRGRSALYFDMKKTMKDWLMGTIDSPIIIRRMI